MGQFYAGDYGPHQHRERKPGSQRRGWLPGKRPQGLPDQAPGRLLDFGCGNGAFLEQMAQQGWQVTGIDVIVPEELARRAAGRFPVLAGSLPHADLAPRTFDVITMWQSLEHVHDPLAVLHEARRLLVPGGQLLISVPNLASASFGWFGANWFGLDLPRHLTHFTPTTLHRMLQRAGFHVSSIRMIRHSSWMRHSAHRRVRRSKVSWRQRLLRARLGSTLAAWYAYLTFQSDSMHFTAISRPDDGS
jgi:2-polyprenyl-3-methyl-5-hydroxy-6-metoxy-1,4-benzoquinol methylase